MTLTKQLVEEGRKKQNGRTYRSVLTHDCDKVPWIKKHNSCYCYKISAFRVKISFTPYNLCGASRPKLK